jgi:hypothetical protein
MKKQITRISIVQTAKVAAAMYFVISLVMVVFIAVPAMLFGGRMGLPILMVLVMPLFYVLFGFIFTVVAAWIYNIVASMIGGIEYTTTEIDKY